MAIQVSGRSARMERAYDRASETFGRSGLTARFTATGVYDKLGLLVLLALATGAIGYATASPGLLVLGLVGGLVCQLVGIFRPATARVVAPLYALAEGLCLG